MKSITVDDHIYNKIKDIAKSKNTSLVTIMREELPNLVDKIKTTEYKKMNYSKASTKEEKIEELNKRDFDRLGQVANNIKVAEYNAPVKSESRALLDMILDLAELDVDAPENKDFVEETFKKIGTKIENYQWANFNLDKRREALKEQRDHFTQLIEKVDKAEEQLKAYVKKVLEIADVKELRGENGSKIYLATYDSVEVINAEKIPDAYKREITNVVVNKTQLKEDIKRLGKEIPGARLVSNVYGQVSRPKKKLISE